MTDSFEYTDEEAKFYRSKQGYAIIKEKAKQLPTTKFIPTMNLVGSSVRSQWNSKHFIWNWKCSQWTYQVTHLLAQFNRQLNNSVGDHLIQRFATSWSESAAKPGLSITTLTMTEGPWVSSSDDFLSHYGSDKNRRAHAEYVGIVRAVVVIANISDYVCNYWFEFLFSNRLPSSLEEAIEREERRALDAACNQQFIS